MAQILQALGIVMPLVLAWFTYKLNQDVNESKKQIDENHARIVALKDQADVETIDLRQRIDKVKVISDYLDILSGPDSLKRRLASRAVLIVLPQEGPDFVRLISADQSSTTGAASQPGRDAAIDALSARRDALIQDLFSDARPTRLAALSDLRAGWLRDDSVFDPLATQGTQQLAAKNVAGVFNALVLLNNMKVDPNGPVRARVVNFARAAASNSPDSAEQSKLLIDRLK